MEGVAAGFVGDLERLILAASRKTSSGSSKRKVAAFRPCMPGNAVREKVRRCGIVGSVGELEVGACTCTCVNAGVAILSFDVSTNAAISSDTSTMGLVGSSGLIGGSCFLRNGSDIPSA